MAGPFPADTIFALSSGAPPAAIAVIRVSGPQAAEAVEALAGPLPAPRRAMLRRLVDPATGEPLDEALLLHFPAGGSVTGETLVELHCHGGRAVVQAVLGALSRQPGLRPAEAGEFTRRALAAGRLDLNAVEGLSDLLRAETEQQRRAAMAMYGGAFSGRVAVFQNTALRIAAAIEAALDFDDEDDVAGDAALAGARNALAALAAEMSTELDRPSAERLRDGIRLVIAGPVNSGKSTLLNHLAGRDAAIVTDIAGTTRDRIEVPVSLGGRPFLLTDTAGFRGETEDAVERIGMARAEEAIEAADILLWLGLPEAAPRADAIRILSRADRSDVVRGGGHDLVLSVHSGEGVDALLRLILARADALLPREGDYALSQRQRLGLAEAVAACREAMAMADPLLMAEHVRDCLAAFDRLTGRASTEDMLDALFGDFCIGK